jgi:type II secretory pathway pseudopilin PulG
MINRQPAARGFTLIETLVYLAIFAMVIGGVVVAAYLLFQSSGKVQTRAMLLQEEQFVMATIERLLGEAASISAPTTGSTGDTLSVNTFGGVSYTLTKTGNYVLLNGAELNNTNTRVTALTFARTASAPDGVTAEITMQTNSPDGQLVTFSASTTKYRRQ